MGGNGNLFDCKYSCVCLWHGKQGRMEKGEERCQVNGRLTMYLSHTPPLRPLTRMIKIDIIPQHRFMRNDAAFASILLHSPFIHLLDYFLSAPHPKKACLKLLPQEKPTPYVYIPLSEIADNTILAKPFGCFLCGR